uniref:Uncharacterized protein n=1 Tax=Siphoviridae sp. ctxzZ3 TaxID=2826523 RepID=A0A8S5NFB9_9CAUD|nr:MAG TPA: protein of unknown function DUF859 [Siphoviridae sp. ctxzZ3]
MVLLSENWKVVSEATRTPGAANVTYQLFARINPQYHSIELNRDYVEIQVTYTMNSGYIYSGSWNFSATGCSDVSGGGTLSGSGTLISGGFWAYHDNSGNYSTSINANLSFYFSAADAYLSVVIELPNIPRSSGVSWKDNKNHVKLDGKDTLKLILDKKVDKYRHSLVWVVGDSGPKWLNTNDIDTEYIFKPTEEMIKYATDTKSVYGYLGVGTYSDGTRNATMIGTATIGFFIDLPEEKYGPVISSAVVKEIGNTKVPEDKVFRYLSKKRLTMQAEVRGFSIAKNVYVMHNKQQYPMVLNNNRYSVDLEGLVDGDVQFVVEDSRGFKTTQEWHGTFVPYFYPTITDLVATRDNPTSSHGYMIAKGKWYNGQSNKLTAITEHLPNERLNTDVVVNSNDFNINKEFSDLNYQNKFTFKLTITDYYGQSVIREYILPGSQWTALFGKFTSLFRMIHVKKTPNVPCGIYNEGDLSTLGRIYAKGGLVIGGDDTFLVKRIGAAGARKTFNAAMNDREDVRITVTAPDGYKTIGVIQAYTDYRCSVSLYNFINGIAYCTVYNSSGWANTPIGASVDVLFYKCK